jgi:YfiH family protein
MRPGLPGRPGATTIVDRHEWAEVELLRVRQVHGTSVLVRRPGDGQEALLGHTADIIVSSDPAIGIAIQTADCVPILIADRRKGVVAAAHAGWRGLAAGVPRIAVEALATEFGSNPADLSAAAGPSIRACCYEVGPDVRDGFMAAGWPDAKLARWFFAASTPSGANPTMPGLRPARRGHVFLDTARAAADQLELAGVPVDRVFVSDLCTASHPDALCSFRRDGGNAGRMVAAIRANIVRNER